MALVGDAAADIDADFWQHDFDRVVRATAEGDIDAEKLYKTVTACRARERELRNAISDLLLEQNQEGLSRQWRHEGSDEDSDGGNDAFEGLTALQQWSAYGEVSETRMAVASVRLCVGAVVEAALVHAAVAEHWALAKPGRTTILGKTKATPEAWAKTADGKKQMAAARLYNDAALVATWTSAHAAFIDDCQLGVLDAPSPSIFTVVNSFSEYDFSDLLAHRGAMAMKAPVVKDALPVLTLLLRAMHTSPRGWQALLTELVPKSTCARTVVGRALVVCCTGMHETAHPAFRLHWLRRSTALKRVFRECSSRSFPDLVTSATSATREAMRRLLATTVSCMPAATRALALVTHPLRMLQAPPLCAPAPGAEACAECFAAATRSFLSGGWMHADDLPAALANAFDEPLVSPRQKYDPTWLGKGSAPVVTPTPFVATAAGVFSAAFRANFLPLWLHAFHHSCTTPRLEAVYHDAIHELNAATALVAELDEKTALRMQRLAIGHVSSALLSADDVFSVTGLSAELCKSPLEENELDVDHEDRGKGLGPTDDEFGRELAMALSWARAAWISEKVLVYELGPRTTGMQILAILRRMRSDRLQEALSLPLAKLVLRKEELLAGLPEQATHLQACLACDRVANPIVNDAKPTQHFDDVGASIAMNCTSCDPQAPDCGRQHLRCAKRASAALRQAVIYEATSVGLAVEQKPVDVDGVASAIARAGAQRSTASGVGARAKRDAKAGMSQRRGAKGCGDDPLLVISLVGRCIGLKGVKYALCAFCAACVEVKPRHRAGGEICCLRCDGRIVTGFDVKKTPKQELGRVCRFCGKVEGSGSSYRTFKSPLDAAGPNERLPAPLRTVHFCPAHQRAWLQQALRTLPTRSVLAHIACGVRPVVGAGGPSRLTNAELGLADDVGVQTKKGKKRKAEERPTEAS